jgi:hypothetical protein
MSNDSSFVGFCSRLGIGGLQLSTIILSLFFALLGLLALPAHASGFFDLSKLALGAFIGSYIHQNRPALKPIKRHPSKLDK